MALLANAQMTVSAAPGTGAFALAAATPSSQTWAAAGALNGAVYSYRAEGAAGWDYGLGTYSASGAGLSRTTVLASTNGRNPVAFGADVIVSQVALPGDIPPASGLVSRLLNGGFSIWQRGPTAADGAVGPDGWRTSFSQGTARSSDVPPGLGCVFSCEVSNASASNGGALYQNLPAADTLDLAGQSAAIGFFAKSVAGSTALQATLNYCTGSTADDFSSVTGVATVTVAATPAGAWTFYSATFTVPAGATKGLQVVLSRAAGTGVTTRFAAAGLQAGSVATPFERRGGLDLALCQQRFRRIAAGAAYKKFAVGLAASTGAGLFLIDFAEMRAAPTFLASGNFAVISTNGGAVAVSNFATDQIDATSVAFYANTVSSTLTAGQSVMLQAQGDTNARIDLACDL